MREGSVHCGGRLAEVVGREERCAAVRAAHQRRHVASSTAQAHVCDAVKLSSSLCLSTRSSGSGCANAPHSPAALLVAPLPCHSLAQAPAARTRPTLLYDSSKNTYGTALLFKGSTPLVATLPWLHPGDIRRQGLTPLFNARRGKPARSSTSSSPTARASPSTSEAAQVAAHPVRNSKGREPASVQQVYRTNSSNRELR